MNEMRKLIEAVEKLDDDRQYRRDQVSSEATEYAAFVAGIEVGNEWQYEFGGTGEDDDKRQAYKEWVDGSRKGLYEDKDEFVAKLDNSYEEKIKEAYLAGYMEGKGVGYDQGTTRMFGRKEETPEEAYEHWKKHGF